MGVAAAAHLAAAGARVVLLESRAIAAGASGRNSGVVQHPFDPALRAIHLETVALYRALAAEAGGGFTLGAEPAGLLLVGLDPRLPRRMAVALALSDPDLEPTFLAGDELRRLEPGLAAEVSACRVAIGYPAPPAGATHAIAALARRRGAEIRTGETVAGLLLDHDRAIGVRLADGRTLEAGAVLVAAGPWSSGLLDPTGRWQPIRPVWGVVVDLDLGGPAGSSGSAGSAGSAAPRHVLEEAAMDAALGDVGRGADATQPDRATDDGDGPDAHGDRPEFSLVTAAGRSSLGSTFLDAEPDIDAWLPRLVARGRRFVPGVGVARVGAIRACARPLSADGRPLLGAVPGIAGAFIAAGHGPWGISTGPASARIVADAILGRAPTIAPELDAARFGAPIEAA